MGTNTVERSVVYALGLGAAAIVGASAAWLPTATKHWYDFLLFAISVCPAVAFSIALGGFCAARIVYRGPPNRWNVGWSSGITQFLCLVFLSLLIGFLPYPITAVLALLSATAGWATLIFSVVLFGIPVAVAVIGWSALFVLYQQR